MDPRDQAQLARLCEAVESSQKKLAIFREKRKELLRQYVGFHYSTNGAPEPVPVSYIEMAVSVYTANLAGGLPQSQITTPITSLKQTARDLQLDVNYVLKASEFKQTLEETVREGLFGPGIVKVGIAASEDGGDLDPGEVFIDPVDLDDWVQDMSVRKYRNAAFAGHKMPMAREDLEADPDVDQDVLRSLIAEDNSRARYGEDRVESIAAGQSDHESKSINDEIWVLHLWMRRERLVLMLPVDSDGKPLPKLLKLTPWRGPYRGPFEFIDFNPVPGNAISLPPLATLRDLQDIITLVYNKLGRQAGRQKKIAVVGDELIKDGERQINADDGDAVRGNAKAVTELNMGGADERNMAFGIHACEKADMAGGNLSSLGGFGPSADTLGQERIIKASASQRITSMQNKVSDFIGAVIKHVAFYEFNNPLLDRTVVRRLPNWEFGRTVSVTTENMTGRFLDLNFGMQPYTNVARTPAEKLDAIGAMFDRYVAPYQEAMAAQEIAIDFNGFLHTVADLAGIDEIDDFLRFGMPSPLPTQQIRGQDPRAPRQLPAPSPSQPRRPDSNRMIQDLMSRPQPQMAGA